MTADFQFGHAGVFVPDRIDHPSPDAALLLFKGGQPHTAAQPHRSAVRMLPAGQYPQQRGFSGSIRPGDYQPFAPQQVQLEIADQAVAAR